MKNMLKKWLSLALVIATLLTFTACGTDSAATSSSVLSVNDNYSSADSVSSSIKGYTSSTVSEHYVGNGQAETLTVSDIPAYSGSPYVIINNNLPNFSADELTDTSYESYSELDLFGRCGVAIASCGVEIMPGKNEERGDISSIKPTGWVQAKYNGISGGYLWNRCHLIGWQLSAENANPKNLITGTRYMNTEGMLPYENMIADYILETGNHVAYRVTPIYNGSNLVCSGVQLEGYSVEDKGDGVIFNVYCYNVQPGISINYATGESRDLAIRVEGEEETAVSSQQQVQSTEQSVASETTTQVTEEMVWIPNTGSKYHSNPSCSGMKSPSQVPLSNAIYRGFEPCKKCY